MAKACCSGYFSRRSKGCFATSGRQDTAKKHDLLHAVLPALQPICTSMISTLCSSVSALLHSWVLHLTCAGRAVSKAAA